MTYNVHIVTGEYRDRQIEANNRKADLYLEQHINSSISESPDYGLGVVATNASKRSEEIAAWYAKEAGIRFDVGGPLDHDIGYDTGVRVGGRGNNNLAYTNMPAVILEPWFASNPTQAAKMNTSDGTLAGAQLLVDLVKQFFPEGGIIALSIGHEGKPSAPNDQGAPIVGGGWESEWSFQVVHKASKLLNTHANVNVTSHLLRIERPGYEKATLSYPAGSVLTLINNPNHRENV